MHIEGVTHKVRIHMHTSIKSYIQTKIRTVRWIGAQAPTYSHRYTHTHTHTHTNIHTYTYRRSFWGSKGHGFFCFAKIAPNPGHRKFSQTKGCHCRNHTVLTCRFKNTNFTYLQIQKYKFYLLADSKIQIFLAKANEAELHVVCLVPICMSMALLYVYVRGPQVQ
jgi:hypothetical protein